MADGAVWLVSASAWTALVSALLTAVGLLAPWWTESVPAEYAPTVTDVSLWIATTRWSVTADDGVETHQGCTYKCNKARFTKPRVITKCQSWSDMAEWAPVLCSAGIPSRAEEKVTTTTLQPIEFNEQGLAPGDYDPTGYNHAVQSEVDVFKNPNAKVNKQGTLPQNTFQISTYRPSEFGKETTTTTLLITYTSTTVTTTKPPGGTLAPPIYVGSTTPMLGAEDCKEPTRREISTAPYTDWELNFDLNIEIMERIYARLNQFLFNAPFYLFAQRPTRMEQVRLIWEAYVFRSPQDEWLGQYQCPSVPARELHYYVWEEAPMLVRNMAREALEPPHVKVEDWSDWKLKEAWEIEILDITTTTLPPFNDPYAEGYKWVETTAPPVIPAPSPPPPRSAYDGDVSSLFTCHLATYDPRYNDEGPWAWFDLVTACSIEKNLEKVWIAKGCLFLALLLSMFYSFPALVLFVGSNHRAAWRFPPSAAFWMAVGSLLFQGAAVISVGAIDSPYAEPLSGWVPPKAMLPGMNGPGMICTVLAMVCSLLALVLAKVGQVVHASIVAETSQVHPEVTFGKSQLDPHAMQQAAKVAWEQPQPTPARLAVASKSTLRNLN
eukprot:gb/GFBE01007684.1/.p1 GENE.gb/GFBE01007684.1/~~gb/GFBE01007684.1/.p1  ORF type:complete len:607 (+),score=109.29 gb/GFBE01007684.1/:1-1821(+)